MITPKLLDKCMAEIVVEYRKALDSYWQEYQSKVIDHCVLSTSRKTGSESPIEIWKIKAQYQELLKQ